MILYPRNGVRTTRADAATEVPTYLIPWPGQVSWEEGYADTLHGSLEEVRESLHEEVPDKYLEVPE
jgi:hypothetical protein